MARDYDEPYGIDTVIVKLNDDIHDVRRELMSCKIMIDKLRIELDGLKNAVARHGLTVILPAKNPQ